MDFLDNHLENFENNERMRHCQAASELSKSVVEVFEAASNSSLSYADFKTEFKNLMKHLKDPHMKHWRVGTEMVQLLSYLVSQTKFWPRQELAQLISMECIPNSVTDALLDSLIQHSEVALIHQLINTIPTITEKTLLKTLTFYLSCEESSSNLQSAEENILSMKKVGDGTPEEASAQRRVLIKKLLQIPSTGHFVLDNIRKISFDHAWTLLEYLNFLEKTHPTATKKSDDQTKPKTPTMLQVFNWLTPASDAHMTQFLLRPRSHVTFVNLPTLVITLLRKAYFRQTEEIKALKGQISLKDKRIQELENEVSLLGKVGDTIVGEK